MTLDAAEKAGVPVVRGLVWTEHTDEAEWYSDDGPDDAEGLYWVKSSNINPGEWDLLVLRQRLDSFRSPDEAKAAAQADYEQRITAALNPDYLSALDTARAEIERLGKERDVALEIAQDLRRKHPMRWKFDMIDEAQSALTAAQERIAGLEGALKPFAAEARLRANLALGPDIDHWPIGGSGLTLGDLRIAAATLSPAVKEPK